MLNQMSVRARLMLLIAAPMLALILMIVLGMSNAGQLNSNFKELYNDRMSPIAQLKRVSDAYAVSIVDAAHKYRAGMLDESGIRQSFSRAQEQIDDNWQAYSATKLTEDEKRLVMRITPMMQRADQLTSELLGELSGGQLRAASAVV